jgi:hypothetical protein
VERRLRAFPKVVRRTRAVGDVTDPLGWSSGPQGRGRGTFGYRSPAAQPKSRRYRSSSRSVGAVLAGGLQHRAGERGVGFMGDNRGIAPSRRAFTSTGPALAAEAQIGPMF